MWNVRSGNRLVDRNMKESAHRKHLLALKRARGMVDHSSPKLQPFVYTKPKKKPNETRQGMGEVERQREIETGIQDGQISLPHHQLISLPQGFTECAFQVATGEVDRLGQPGEWLMMQKLVRRLLTAKPQYSRAVNYKRELDKYRSSMANSRMTPFYDFDVHPRPLSSKC